MAMDMEQWVRGEDAAWALKDVEKILSFYTDDCLYEDLAIGRTSHGKGEVRAFLKDIFTSVPDFKIEVRSFFASSDYACMECLISGTNTGNVPGLPPATGKSFSLRGVHICQLREGKACRVSDYYDMATMMRQLGILPPLP